MERKELLILILVLLLILVIGYAVYNRGYYMTGINKTTVTDYLKPTPATQENTIPDTQAPPATGSTTQLDENTLNNLDKQIQELQSEELTDTDLLVE